MTIWIDGDACPKLIKDVLYRAAIRTKKLLIIVSNHLITTPASPYIKRHQVGFGFDVADNHIVAAMVAGDLVITADIPLANDVIAHGGLALNPRGELYSPNNIKQHLARRNMNETLRGSGAITGGPPTLSAKDVQRFANALDKYLAQSPGPSSCTE